MSMWKKTLSRTIKRVNRDYDMYSFEYAENVELSNDEKTRIIMGILNNYYIPPIVTDDNHNVLDDKVLWTIASFLDNEFNLSDNAIVEELNLDISGLTFNELREEVQDDFLNYQLSFVMIDFDNKEQVNKQIEILKWL